MTEQRDRARADFKRLMGWVLVAAAAMVAAALAYLAATGDLTSHMVVATVIGVFFSVLLGSGLMAASWFSSKSGHDQEVGDAATRRDDPAG